MPTHFKIEGLSPYDGEHPIDFSYFTNREFHTIKRLSGVLAPDVQEQFLAGDNDLVVAFIAIALERAGLHVDEDRLWEADSSKFLLVVEPDPEDADADPPAQPPTERGGDGSSDARSDPSGSSSLTASDDSATSPSSTGALASDTGSDSVPLTSVA